jgi:hypothetical protein
VGPNHGNLSHERFTPAYRAAGSVGAAARQSGCRPSGGAGGVAGIDEISVNEEIRQAIGAHIEARRQNAAFQERLRASINRNREILERLAR